MAKVDWITWKTNPQEIINPEKVREELGERIQDYNVYMSAVVSENINHEIKVGGLNPEALTFLGTTPAYEKADNIMKRIDHIKEEIQEMQEKILKAIDNQKRIEKKQLTEAIQEKIEEENKKLHNMESLRERVTESNAFINIDEVDKVIEMTKERINSLEERLEVAESL